MKAPIITSVSINNRQKRLVIGTKQGSLFLPFVRLDPSPSSTDRIAEVSIDRELAKRAVTYRLESGKEGSVHLDAFLDHARDPEFMRNLIKYKLTLLAQDLISGGKISRGELSRRLATSMSQVNRLLDQAYTKKSLDEMIRLLAVIGCEIHFHFELPSWLGKEHLKKNYDFSAKLAA